MVTVGVIPVGEDGRLYLCQSSGGVWQDLSVTRAEGETLLEAAERVVSFTSVLAGPVLHKNSKHAVVYVSMATTGDLCAFDAFPHDVHPRLKYDWGALFAKALESARKKVEPPSRVVHPIIKDLTYVDEDGVVHEQFEKILDGVSLGVFVVTNTAAARRGPAWFAEGRPDSTGPPQRIIRKP